MKKYKALLFLLCLVAYSGTAFSQLVEGECPIYSPYCGPGGPITPTAEVKYAVGTTGDVAIANNDTSFGESFAKIHVVKNGSSQIIPIKLFEAGTRISAIKIHGARVFYILHRSQSSEIATSVRSIDISNPALYSESIVFNELVNSTQTLTKIIHDYGQLTIYNESVYVKKLKTTFVFPEVEECPPELICSLPDFVPPISTTQEFAYLRKGINSTFVEMVEGIPFSTTSQRYSFSVQNDNIYRYDSETGTTQLWLQNNNEAGRGLRDLVVVGDYLYFTSTSDIGEGPTNLIVVNINDDIPQPKKRLATDLSGTLLLAYQLEEISKKFSLEVSLYDKENNLVNSELHEMTPSRLACGQAVTTLEKRKMVLKCLEEQNVSGQIVKMPIENCSVSMSLNSNGENGGHNEVTHTASNGRWGKINRPKSTFISIPKTGLEVNYEAPEASGEALLEFELKTPDGKILSRKEATVFKVKSRSELVRLSITGLDTTSEITSHPEDGNYVTQTMHDKLAKVISGFRGAVEKKYGESSVPTLRTGGASLHWGGLFDINRDWSAPHCTHRDGIQLDLSMNIFSVYDEKTKKDLKKTLDDKIQDAKLIYPYDVESPTGTKHWHVQLSQ